MFATQTKTPGSLRVSGLLALSLSHPSNDVRRSGCSCVGQPPTRRIPETPLPSNFRRSRPFRRIFASTHYRLGGTDHSTCDLGRSSAQHDILLELWQPLTPGGREALCRRCLPTATMGLSVETRARCTSSGPGGNTCNFWCDLQEASSAAVGTHCASTTTRNRHASRGHSTTTMVCAEPLRVERYAWSNRHE